jgi:uncharacterized protein YodC (DUF2158 family)
MQTNNAHEYTDEQIQSAIDAAFPDGALADCDFGLDNFPNQSCWEDEAPNRLAIARAFLAALPKPAEPDPWTLPAPPAVFRWHREDWTQDMLPEGYRPLLDGEARESVDEWSYYGKEWRSVYEYGPAGAHVDGTSAHHRTHRPLPAEASAEPDQAKTEKAGVNLEEALEKIEANLESWEEKADAMLDSERWHMKPRVEGLVTELEEARAKIAEMEGKQAKPADDGPPWIPHDGGPCLINDEEVEEFEVLWSDGRTSRLNRPSTWPWNHRGGCSDILKYRVLKWKPGHGPQEASKADEPAQAEAQQPDYTITATPGVTVHVPAGQTAKFKPDGWNQEAKQLLDAAFQPAQPWTPAPGDVVRLKSGGPEMTVSRVNDENEVVCEWFSGYLAHVWDFSAACLTPAKEGQP